MTSKKLGALLRSAPPATAVNDFPVPPQQVQQRSEIEVLPVGSELSSAPWREVPLQVLVPEHIRKQLGIKAAQDGQSLRALILYAVRSLGIQVTDEEIKGKRGFKRTTHN